MSSHHPVTPTCPGVRKGGGYYTPPVVLLEAKKIGGEHTEGRDEWYKNRTEENKS